MMEDRKKFEETNCELRAEIEEIQEEAQSFIQTQQESFDIKINELTEEKNSKIS